jgi:hypothetical protein
MTQILACKPRATSHRLSDSSLPNFNGVRWIVAEALAKKAQTPLGGRVRRLGAASVVSFGETSRGGSPVASVARLRIHC